MSYTPINWQTGDTITAEKMNKMDNGWSATVTTSTMFDGSCTTESDSDSAYGEIDLHDDAPDTLVITFNNTEYTCQKNDDGEGAYYGELDSEGIAVFTTYPFCVFAGDPWFLLTETAGTYAIKLVEKNVAYETSEEFDGITRKIATEVAENAKDYRYAQQTTEVFNGTVVASTSSQNAYYAEISLSKNIESASEITVTFPSPIGEVTAQNEGLGKFGATYNPFTNTWDWSEYTFAVEQNAFTGVTKFWTQTKQTYTDLVISAKLNVMTTDDEFSDAVLASRPTGSFTSNYTVDFVKYKNRDAVVISARGTDQLICLANSTFSTDAPSKLLFGGASKLPDGLVIGQFDYISSNQSITVSVTNVTDATISINSNAIEFNVISLKTQAVQTHYYLEGSSL